MKKASREKTSNIITFALFEEKNLSLEVQNLLSETRDDTERGNQSDDDSTIPTSITEEEIDVMSPGDESDGKPMSTDMLEDIRDSSQSHPIVNRIKTCYKIHNCTKRSQS